MGKKAGRDLESNFILNSTTIYLVMIERIEWNNHPNELPSPFMRGKGERPLRITFHSQSLINLSDEENSIVELLRELVKLGGPHC